MSAETIYRYLRLDRRQGGQLWRCLCVVSEFERKRRGSPETVADSSVSATSVTDRLSSSDAASRPTGEAIPSSAVTSTTVS
ncbi:MAG: hypothetical protein K2Y51_17405 [Gammaproteobacteria bacterium]|nr:hypothetical protein [Gammaproteobacteria bacterium]